MRFSVYAKKNIRQSGMSLRKVAETAWDLRFADAVLNH